MVDLLFSQNACQGEIESQTLYHLMLDRSLKAICPDIRKVQIFIGVLSKPLLTETAIKYRQDVLKDFLANPELLPKLLVLFGKFKEIKKQFDDSQKTNRRFFNNPDSSDNIKGTRNLLRINALLLKRVLILVNAIRKQLDGLALCSIGLSSLKEEATAVVSPNEYKELLEICTYFENIRQTDPYNVRITINDKGRICECQLAAPKKPGNNDGDKRRNGIFYHKKLDVNRERVSFQLKNDTTFQEIHTQSYKEIIDAFENLYIQIESSFSRCYSDCQYYDVAVKYCHSLLKTGCKLSYPRVSSTGSQNIVGLKDLFLILQDKDATRIIANDFRFQSPDMVGVAVFGKNGCGKTAYIRSIGTAQILAQAGLPVPADSASIQCYSTIAAYFSEAEKYDGKSGVGRFEQEAIEMSRLLDSVSTNSLLLFNEVFQSTSYDEGAECLADVLDYLSAIKSKWILVTHLKQIRPHLPTNSIILHAMDGYKVSMSN